MGDARKKRKEMIDGRNEKKGSRKEREERMIERMRKGRQGERCRKRQVGRNRN